MSATIDRAAGDDDLLGIWRGRFESPVSGWDFTELKGEMTEEVPPWSYQTHAREQLRSASHALDMPDRHLAGPVHDLLEQVTARDFAPNGTVALMERCPLN